MKKINLVLVGFGNVGEAFFHLVQEKKQYCRDRYSLDLGWKALIRSCSVCMFDQKDNEKLEGLEPSEYADYLNWGKKTASEDIISLTAEENSVLVDCSVSDAHSGVPGYDRLTAALKNGWHVVTSDKGPLVFDLKSLRNETVRNRRALKFSATTGAALPALDISCFSLAASEIYKMEGILNGTSNYLLTKMMEGVHYSDALREAQAMGIAEPDPSNDIEGWDTATKIILLTNSLFDTEFKLDDVKVEGVSSIPEAVITSCVLERKRPKLLGRMTKDDHGIRMEVVLSLLDETHPLYRVEGVEKGISFFTDTMGNLTITGGKSDPRSAAACLLKDLVNIYRQW